jgi:DNA polymerase III subunit delta
MSPLPSVKDMQAGHLSPVYFFYGPEDLLIEETIHPFLSEVVEEGMRDFNQDIFHTEEVKPDEFFALCSAFPMMSERRLVLLRGLEKATPKLLTDLASYLDDPSPTTCLILTATKVDKRKKAWKAIIKQANASEFKALNADRLPQFMQERMQAMGVDLPRNQAGPLAEQLSGAPLRLVLSELEKLFLLVGEGGKVSAKEIALCMGVDQDVSPFILGEKLMQRQLRPCLAVLKELLKQDDAAFSILPLLHRQFARLWFLKQMGEGGLSSKEIAGQLGLNAWAVQKSLTMAPRWSMASLEGAADLLLTCDAGLKGHSPLSKVQQLTQLVVALCRLT